MTDEQERELVEQLQQLSGEIVLGLFLDYHGTQLLDEGFAEHCHNEGVVRLDWIED